jgi:hypothetical protein
MKRISDRQRQRLKEYAVARGRFMQESPNCQRCGEKATELHHSRGRIGSLLTDLRWFIGLCHSCHDFVHNNPNEARKAGLLCEKGKWGSTK